MAKEISETRARLRYCVRKSAKQIKSYTLYRDCSCTYESKYLGRFTDSITDYLKQALVSDILFLAISNPTSYFFHLKVIPEGVLYSASTASTAYVQQAIILLSPAYDMISKITYLFNAIFRPVAR